MKKTLLSLVAIVAMACASAQDSTAVNNLRREVAVRLEPAMQAAGVTKLVAGPGAHSGTGHRPNVTQRNANGNGLAQNGNGNASQGGGQQGQAGARTKSDSLASSPAGVLFVPGQVYTVNGQPCILGADGNFYPVGGQQQPAQYQLAPTQQQPVQQPAQYQQPVMASTPSSGGQQVVDIHGNYQLEPGLGNPWYHDDPATGFPVMVKGPTEIPEGDNLAIMSPKPGDVIIDKGTNKVVLLGTKFNRIRGNRGYGLGTDPDEDHLPTAESAAAIQARRGLVWNGIGWVFGTPVSSCGTSGCTISNCGGHSSGTRFVPQPCPPDNRNAWWEGNTCHR